MKKKESFSDSLKYLVYFTQISITMITPILLYTFIGWWVVCKFNLSNIIVILALLLGVAVGFASCYKFMQMMQRKADESERESKP